MNDATVHVPDLTDPSECARLDYLDLFTGHTFRGYSQDLAAWFTWCADRQLDPLTDVRRANIEAYSRWMLDTKAYAAKTRERRISTLCGFYRRALEDERIEADPARFVRRPKVSKESQTLGLGHLQFSRYLEAAEASNVNDHALAELLGMLGLRCFEACAVDIEDLGEVRGHRVLTVIGKGGDSTVIPLPVPVFRAIDRAVGGRTSGPLLRTRTGARFDRSAVRRSVARVAKRAGITAHVHPHVLRHTFVTQLLDGGADIRDTQIAARHADPRMTMRYDRARKQLDRHANYVLAARMAS
jgi:integrase/recombinase XerD